MDYPDEAPPALPAGPPPPIPDADSDAHFSTPALTSFKVEKTDTASVSTQGLTRLDLNFDASNGNTSGAKTGSEPDAGYRDSDLEQQCVKSYVEGIVNTAATRIQHSDTRTETPPAVATFQVERDSTVKQPDAPELNGDRLVTSPVPDHSDISSSSSSVPTVRSVLLTSPRSYTGSRPSSRRSSLGSDAGSLASDLSMRGAAPPLKPARRESVIETLEKKRRESIGPKLKGLQVPSRRASTGTAVIGPMKALPTIATLPSIGEKGFGVKPFRSVQPFAPKTLDTDAYSSRTTRSMSLNTQEPRQRWSYAGNDSVFDSLEVTSANTSAVNAPTAKPEPLSRKLETKPVEVKPVAAPRSFAQYQSQEKRLEPSFQVSVSKNERKPSVPDTKEAPLSPRSPPPTAAKPTLRKPMTIQLPSSKTTAMSPSHLSPKSPPPTAPKPVTPMITSLDSQPQANIDISTKKPSLPPKPHLRTKPKKLPSASVETVRSPSLSPTSPRSMSEDEIQPAVSVRTRALPELPSSPPAVHEAQILPVDSGHPKPTRNPDVKSPSQLTDALQRDLLVSPRRLNSDSAHSPQSPTSPVAEPDIHAIISSRTVKTETTVAFFPSSPRPVLEPEIIPAKAENSTTGLGSAKVIESKEIIKVRPETSFMAEKKNLANTSTHRSGAIIKSPTSPPTQGPMPFKRLSTSTDTTEDFSTLPSDPLEDTYQSFSLNLQATPLRQGPKPFGVSSPTAVSDDSWASDFKIFDSKPDSGATRDDPMTSGGGSATNTLLISIDDADPADVPSLPGSPPPSLPGSAPPPVPVGSHLLDEDIGQLSPAESGIRMDGSASDSATLESQSIDSLEDGLDYISSVPSSSSHSKTESEISITPSIDFTKPDSPASSTTTLIHMNGDDTHLEPSKLKTSVLSSRDDQALSPSPTPSDADSGIGSTTRSDLFRAEKGKNLLQQFSFCPSFFTCFPG